MISPHNKPRSDMTSPVLEQLREQTRPAHLALESQPLLKKLLSNQLTKIEYCHILQSMLAFYQTLEADLIPGSQALLEKHPDTNYRYLSRAPLLADDCQKAGCPSSGFTSSPTRNQLSENGAYFLGVLYVVEGSTLGGRVIARHLAQTLGIRETSGASFFNIYQRNNSWNVFCRWLTRNSESYYQHDISTIIKGADMTFSTFRTHLDQWQFDA